MTREALNCKSITQVPEAIIAVDYVPGRAGAPIGDDNHGDSFIVTTRRCQGNGEIPVGPECSALHQDHGR